MTETSGEATPGELRVREGTARAAATGAAYAIRPATAADLPLIGPIEDSGHVLFTEAFGDLSQSALSTPAMSGEERAALDGFLLVAGEPAVGFVHVRILQAHAHLEQVSVHPDHGQRGVGAALVAAACAEAERRGYAAITLMTYADLPWNGPFYVHQGFVEVPESESRLPYQRELAQTEERLELSSYGRRILMRRELRAQRSAAELEAFLPTLDATPKDVGTLALLVRRPAVGQREVLESGLLDPAVGLVGDTWSVRSSSRTSDGSAHPDMQLNVMSHPMVQFLAQDPAREPLAGDQLYLDLDLSHENLPAGTRLVFERADAGAGTAAETAAVIEITAQPHTGCAKFIARFGREAMSFVNGPHGRPRRLRGLN
ncbi:MAG: GNAT family N-acetyltransferase, partial [Nocardioides sp.]